MRTRLGQLLLLSSLVSCAPSHHPRAAPSDAARASARSQPISDAARVAAGFAQLEHSRYREAEATFRAALRGAARARALLGLAEVLLETGRYGESVEVAAAARESGAPPHVAAALGAEALRRRGKLPEAEALLTGVAHRPEARAARLLLGEIQLEQGRRGDGAQVLMGLIEDYNGNRTDDADGRALAIVGRAAHLLRSPHDANDAFNEAESALAGDVRTLLWRAELFLEKHDPGHAEEVTLEVLRKAPDHPEALVFMALVKLTQTYDFDEAERLARRALEVNPNFGRARFVLAGIALRDLELEAAERQIEAGLAINPRDLELLSLQAAVRFLSDDPAGFERSKREVLARNPRFTRLYEIVGEYAEWEHRYDEIVKQMREAVLIDGEDANARAELGLNLLRAGDDSSGVGQLKLAFEQDPFNVRVYNTLNLYERVIPQDYESARHGVFTIRYHKKDRAVLERYVPRLLEQAWAEMRRRYGFTPSTPVGVELYPSREHFSVRTSGLPSVGIQGVCFGQTFASMSPGKERFNLGMTLWHELSHVFHIQLTKSHVPRWLTEGLAEWETLTSRPEWKREHDAELYDALRSGRLPNIEQMNRAFTRAEDMRDMATAYYASTQVVRMIATRWGVEKVAQLLQQWGKGTRTPEVLKAVLGVTPTELDAEFAAFIRAELARYDRQFVPMRRAPALDRARADVKGHPEDARTRCALALAALEAGDRALAEEAVKAALARDPKLPDALWLSVRVAAAAGDAATARARLEELLRAGHDGYDAQMLLAELAEQRKDLAAYRVALEQAHGFDPSASEPLGRLALLAREIGDIALETRVLMKLAVLEEHEPPVYQRLIRLLLDQGRVDEALRFGEAAIYVDMMGVLTHGLYAEALLAKKRYPDAIFELNTAVLCPGEPSERADAHARLAEAYRAAGDPAKARKHADQARSLDPSSPRLKNLR